LRRPLVYVCEFLIALALVAGPSLIQSAPASAATVIAPTTTCNNSTDNTPGLGAICEVRIENTISPVGGSALVTVRECHGAAGDPEAACSTYSNVLAGPVTSVNQCNYSMDGGGGTLRCSVVIVNTFVGLSPGESAASVNQCVGSGAGGIHGPAGQIHCNPYPATTTNATITQCNDSANGLTLVDLTCTVAGMETSTNSVTVNQCNNSTNGGGALVICSANVTNIIPAAVTAPPTAVPTIAPTAAPPTAAPTAAPTATPSLAPGVTAAPTLAPGVTPTPTLAPGVTAAPTLAPGTTPAPTQVSGTAAPTAIPAASEVPAATERPAPTEVTTAATATLALPNTTTTNGTPGNGAVDDGGPALPSGLMFVAGLAMIVWFRRRTRSHQAAESA
jgi:hypothetical protein